MKLERPKWPENKNCSAMITINLNAELVWLQLDPTCKDMPKTLSRGQYGMTRGVDRILKILEERGIRATFFTPGWVAEQYPDLKANQNFMDLSHNLNETEDDIANARKYYNGAVKQYNMKVQMFPGSLIAGLFHFETKKMFEVENAVERQNVQVKF